MKRGILWLLGVTLWQVACGGRTVLDPSQQTSSTGGSPAAGSVNTGGLAPCGISSGLGGAWGTGSGGYTLTGGAPASAGGLAATGGSISTGGSSRPTGGLMSTGGSKGTGGVTMTGGASASGGTHSTGGATNMGGSDATVGVVSAVTAGDGHSCAVLNGRVRCWGGDAVGQLGDGVVHWSSSIAVQVMGLTSGVTAVAGGAGYTCAIVNNGVQCWGGNKYGAVSY